MVSDFARQVVEVKLALRDPVIQVGSIDVTRDFTDVRDVVRAYRLLMEKGAIGEVYHVASGRAVAIKELLNKLLALSDIKMTIEPAEEHMRPSDIRVAVGDATKLRRLTGWQPEIALDVSLRDILDCWRNRVGSDNQ